MVDTPEQPAPPPSRAARIGQRVSDAVYTVKTALVGYRRPICFAIVGIALYVPLLALVGMVALLVLAMTDQVVEL